MSQFTLPPWIEGKDRKVLQAYVNGVKPKKIKEKFGVSSSFIASALKRYAIPPQLELRRRGILPPTCTGEGSNRNSRQHRDIRLAAAVDEYMENKDAKLVEVAKKHHIATANLSSALKAEGVVIKAGRRKGHIGISTKSERNQAIVKAVVEEGKTLKDVGAAQIPPISRERVRQIVEKAGYKLGFRDCIKEKMRLAKEAQRYHHPQEDEIVEVLRADRNFPKDIAERFGVELSYLQSLREIHKIPRGNRLNWRSDEKLENERKAIDAYYNRPDLTGAQISEQILKVSNPAAITQLIKRRGLQRTRGYKKFGPGYVPFTGPKRQFSKETREAAIKDYKDPMIPLKDIYEKYDITPPLLQAWRSQCNCPAVPRAFGPGSGTPLSAVQAEWVDRTIRAGHAAGKSRNAIANELGLQHRIIARRAEVLGLEFPTTNYTKAFRPPELSEEDIARLDAAIHDGIAEGKSMSLVASEAGFSFGRVQRRAKHLGVKFPAHPKVRKFKTKKTPRKSYYVPSVETMTRNVKRAERNAQVITDYLAGMNTTDIMKKHSIANSQLYMILDKANIPRQRKPKDRSPVTPTTVQQAMLDDYAKGMPRHEIMAKYTWLENKSTRLDRLCIRFGVKRPAVYKRVKGTGSGRSMTAKQHEMILRMYKPGKTPLQRLADKVGVSYATVRNLLVKQGVYKPVPSELYSKVGKRKKRK